MTGRARSHAVALGALTVALAALVAGVALSRALVIDAIDQEIVSTEDRNRRSGGADFGLIRLPDGEVWFVETETALAVPEGVHLTKPAWSLDAEARPGGPVALPFPDRTRHILVGTVLLTLVILTTLATSVRTAERALARNVSDGASAAPPGGAPGGDGTDVVPPPG